MAEINIKKGFLLVHDKRAEWVDLSDWEMGKVDEYERLITEYKNHLINRTDLPQKRISYLFKRLFGIIPSEKKRDELVYDQYAEYPIYAVSYTCGTNGVDDSCTISELNTLISSASDGDTIYIATGTHNWTPSASSYVNVNKRVTISGSGYCGPTSDDDIGQDCGDIQSPTGTWPVIIDSGDTNNYGVFKINVTSVGPGIARITGIHFQGKTYTSSYQYCDQSDAGGHIRVNIANIAPYRIDNNFFETTSNTYMNCDIVICPLNTYGVIDHNYFNSTGSQEGKSIMVQRLDIGEYIGDCATGWLTSPGWGGANFVFIEDNTINGGTIHSMGPMFVDSVCGAKLVMRYNYIYNAFSEFHGLSSGSYTTSGYAAEVYNNTFTNSANTYRAWWMRGGTGYVHNNNVTGTYNNCAFSVGESGSRSSWNTINGSRDWDGNCQSGSSAINNTNVSIANGFDWDCGDASAQYPTGYPTICQPGWGQMAGAEPGTIQPQEYEPIRVWSNTGTISCTALDCATYPNCWHGLTETETNYISLNRDYFYSSDDSVKPSGYKTYDYPHPYQNIWKNAGIKGVVQKIYSPRKNNPKL